jgi:hypothetical protein
MRWGKIILIFQAIVTLIIGIVFLIQVLNIEYNYEPNVIHESVKYNITDNIIKEQLARYETFKKRFLSASYILVIISIIELLLIWKLLDEKPAYSPEFNFQSQFSLVK